jgi:diguanylate cyclase (GGDEF)-like protein
MKKKIELLKSVDLFSTLRIKELEIVAKYSRYYTYRKGEMIFNEGSHNEELFIIRDGEVLITKHGDDHRDVELARFISGECFGEMDLLDSAPRSAIAQSLKDTTLLIFPIKGVAFKDVLQRHPEIFAQILNKLLARVASRIRTANALISEKAPWVHNLRKQVMKDKLTGLYNRVFLEEELPSILSESTRPVSMIMIKPDRFKDINDTYGHEAGDRVLRLMADTFTLMLKKEDIAIRVKGDEFSLLMVDTDTNRAKVIAEEIRLKLIAMDLGQITKDKRLPFPVSIGVATYPEHAENSVTLTDLASDLMYRARKNGGDRVISAS